MTRTDLEQAVARALSNHRDGIGVLTEWDYECARAALAAIEGAGLQIISEDDLDDMRRGRE